jgi:hypothetical protein
MEHDDSEDYDDTRHPMPWIEWNAGRGAIVNVPEEDRISYYMTFKLHHDSHTTVERVEYQARDDKHASNKANYIVRLAIADFAPQGWDYSNLGVFRVDGTPVPNEGQCTCPDEGSPDHYCPTHGNSRTRRVPHVGTI